MVVEGVVVEGVVGQVPGAGPSVVALSQAAAAFIRGAAAALIREAARSLDRHRVLHRHRVLP